MLIIAPIRAQAPINTYSNSIIMRNVLIQFDSWGEFIVYEGPTINIVENKIYCDLMIRENSIIEKTPIFPFLKQSYNQIFGLIYSIETHLFGDDYIRKD